MLARFGKFVGKLDPSFFLLHPKTARFALYMLNNFAEDRIVFVPRIKAAAKRANRGDLIFRAGSARPVGQRKRRLAGERFVTRF